MLEHVLLPLLVLLVAYCAGRFLPPIGDFYAALLLAIGKVCQAVQKGLERFTASPPPGTQSTSPGLAVIARLVGLLVGLMVLAGEFFSSYAASPTLFGQQIGVEQLPGHGLAAPAVAVLVFSLCVAFGICFLDAAEWVPPEVRVFDVPQAKRKAVKWFAGSSLVGSVLAMALFYAERTFYLLNPTGDITVALQIATFVLLGLLVGGAGLVAVSMVVVGLQALTQVVLAMAAFVARALVDVVEFLGRHFSRPLRAHVTEDGITVPAHSVEEIGETSMNEQGVGLYYGGTLGLQMRVIMQPTVRRLRADDLVASGGIVNFDRLVEPVALGEDVSPPRADQASILARAVSEEQGYTEIFKRLGVGVVDANLRLPSIGASLWFFLDRDVLPFSVEMLRAVKRKLPRHTIAVVTQIDESDRRSDMACKGLRVVRQLWEEGVIATTFVFSVRSAFAMTVKHSGGEAKQMEFMAQTLTALLLAETHSQRNRSCVEVLRALGRLSPFVGCAFASDRLSPLRLTGLQVVLQLLCGKDRPVGDLEDMRLQAEHVSQQVLTDPDCQAIHGGIQPNMPALLVCTIPLTWRDRRFGQVQEALMTFLGRSFPWVVSVMVRGNGVPMHVATDPLDDFYVQASCLYPLSPDFFEGGGGHPELTTARGEMALPEALTEHLIDSSQADRLPLSNGVTRDSG